MLEFTVRDTGTGIPLNRQQDVFEPFRQAHCATNACIVGGTGLGLAIARKLVERMGGEISLESSTAEESHGSTFRFTIPYYPAVPTQGANVHAKREGSVFGLELPKLRGTVLIVDDNRVNLKLAERFVTKMGCTVEMAENGAIAVAKYRSDPSIEIILMDKWMPVMDGMEAVREIRTVEAKENRPRIPIIALTAAAMTGDREECLEAGCDAYITKPLNQVELRTLLTKYFEAR